MVILRTGSIVFSCTISRDDGIDYCREFCRVWGLTPNDVRIVAWEDGAKIITKKDIEWPVKKQESPMTLF